MTPIQRYADFFASMTEKDVARLGDIMTEDVHFRDPFNDIYGLSGVQKTFNDMYHALIDPLFSITNVTSGNQNIDYMNWELNVRPRRAPKKFWIIQGVSGVRFSPGKKAFEHIDYWDAGEGFYEKLPLLGGVLRLIKRRMKV